MYACDSITISFGIIAWYVLMKDIMQIDLGQVMDLCSYAVACSFIYIGAA